MGLRVKLYPGQPEDESGSRSPRPNVRIARRKLTSFVGREAMLDTLAELVDIGVPLVTVVGPPGVGKTRIALRLAETYAAKPVVFCDLRGVDSPAGLAAKVAESLDGHLDTGRELTALVDAVGALLASQGRLVILDNFEQLVDDGTGPVLHWLRHAHDCSFVVTSRRMVRIEGEHVVDLPPLAVASSQGVPSEAARLFVDRAQAVEPAFDASAEAEIHGLVSHLQGMPLAIELAAGQMKRQRPGKLLDALKRGPTIALRTAQRDVEPEHRSLRAAIETSWSALKAVERAALSQLTVFRQGFDETACEEVVHLDDFTNAPPAGDVICALREASFLHVDRGLSADEPIRWDMYEAIREYASEFPTRNAESRHAAHYIARGGRWLSKMGTPDEPEARARLVRELGNLQSAFEHLLTDTSHDPALLAELALILHGVHQASRPGLAIEPLTVALQRLETNQPDPRARLHLARGICYRVAGETSQARADFASVRTDSSDEPRRLAEVDFEEAVLAYDCGEVQEARALLTRAIESVDTASDPRLECRARTWLGMVLTLGFQDASALGHFRRALDIAQAVGDLRQEAFVRLWTAVLRIFFQRSQPPEELQAQITVARHLRNTEIEILAEQVLGILYLDLGETAKSRIHLERSQAVSHESGLRHYLTCVHFWLNAVAEAEDAFPDTCQSDERLASRFEALADHRNEALALVQMSTLIARRGEVKRARDLLARGRRVGALSEDEAISVFAKVQEARIDLAESALRLEAGDEGAAKGRRRSAMAHIGAARRWSTSDSGENQQRVPLVGRSPEARWALRLFERELTAADASPSTLRVRTDGAAFRLGSAPVVSLPKRSIIRRAMQSLVERRLATPGTAITPPEFLSECWPGERFSSRVTSQRLRQIITRLRKAGLGDILIRHPSGYLLDPDIAVEIVSHDV